MTIEEVVASLEEIAPLPEDQENLAPETLEQLVSRGTVIKDVHNSSQWALGDLSIKVEHDLGAEGLAAFALQLGEKPGTMRQYRWVSSKFPTKDNRATHLSWSHYRYASGTDNPLEWIQMAVDADWTVSQLRNEIMASQDRVAIDGHVPCAECERSIQEGAIFIRYGNEKRSMCSWECVMSFAEKQLEPETTVDSELANSRDSVLENTRDEALTLNPTELDEIMGIPTGI
jgi:hypothetical protein